MIDVRLMDQEMTPSSSSAGSDMEDNEDESEGGMTEIRFVPDDKAVLDSLFQAMNECAALHPDTDDSEQEEEGGEGDEEENEDESGMYEDADEDHSSHQNGNSEDAMDAD